MSIFPNWHLHLFTLLYVSTVFIFLANKYLFLKQALLINTNLSITSCWSVWALEGGAQWVVKRTRPASCMPFYLIRVEQHLRNYNKSYLPLFLLHINIVMYSHTLKKMYKITLTLSCTQTHTLSHKNTLSLTQTHWSQTRTHSNTKMYKNTHTLSLLHTLTHSQKHIHSNIIAYTHTYTHTSTHKHTRTHVHTYSNYTNEY